MSRAVPSLAIVLVLCATSVLACAGAQEPEPEAAVEAEPPPPPPPEPQAVPQVWDAEASYRLGWPIRIRAGIRNSGEAVVNVPAGDYFGVSLRARRGEDVVACESILPEAARGGLIPLATGSAAERTVHLDRQCAFAQPGTYIVEVVVTVPPYEGSDIEGPQAPVSITFEIPQPEEPLVAQLLAQPSYEIGSAMEATLRITNYGAEPVSLAPATRILVTLRAESNGETVPCEAPPRGRGGRPSELAQGESREVPVVLSERCQLNIPGAYVITPSIEIPRIGARSFTGTLDAAPVEIEVVAGEEEETPPPADDVDE